MYVIMRPSYRNNRNAHRPNALLKIFTGIKGTEGFDRLLPIIFIRRAKRHKNRVASMP